MDPKKKFQMFTQNQNFCVVPWTNCEILADGTIKTCSLGRTKLGNLHEKSFDEILNDQPIKKIKQNLLNNKPDSNCVRCQVRQISEDKFEHLRGHYNNMLRKQDVDYENIDAFDMHFIDLHWSNICNLRCTMCNPVKSSLIAKDENVFITPINNDVIDSIIKKVVANQYKMQEVYLSGGEPFYIPANIKLLESISNKNIPIRINTNMHWQKNNRLYKILKTFNNVQLTMSCDALNKKFDYIRTGGDWKKFKEMFEYVRNDTNFDIRVNMIFSVQNAMDVSYNIRYFYYDQNIKDITINLLDDPEELSANNYPANKKQVVIDDLNKLLSEIPKDNRNLQAQIKLCLERIMQPNKFDYKNKMDEIYSRYKRPWTQIHEDLA